MTPRRAGAAAGFTLLEVLAAAMIFAMVVTVLISTSGAAVHQAGLSASRLEASLIAEQELALLESFLNTQRTPPEDKEEIRDRFAVRVYSEPALDDFGGVGAGGGLGSSAASGLGSGSGASAGAGVAAILAIEAPGLDAFLLRYEIRVEWIEGALPATVRRTTYAFDWEGARAALPDLFPAAGGLEEALGGQGADDAGGPELPPGLAPPTPRSR